MNLSAILQTNLGNFNKKKSVAHLKATLFITTT